MGADATTMRGDQQTSSPIPASIEQLIAQRAPDPVFFVAADWLVSYANQSACDLLSHTAHGITGSSLWSVMPEFADAHTRRLCCRAMEQKTPVDFERRFSSGQCFHVRLVPIEDGAALYFREITELKSVTQKLSEHEEDLADLLENGATAIQLVGDDGTIVWANQGELDMLGYAPEEYIGRNIRDFHVEASAAEDILRRLAAQEKLHDYHARLRSRAGSVRHVLIRSGVCRKIGPVTHTRCFTRDVTSERMECEWKERLGAILGSSDDAIISKDLNGIVTSWNTSAERLFGYTEEEAVGRSISSLLIPDDRQAEELGILERLRAGERLEHLETRRKCKNGSLLDVSLTISPVRDAEGRVIGASKIARDVTERHRIETDSLLLGAIVDSSDDAIISKDLNGVITSWNKSAERLFGYRAEEAIGQSVSQLLIPEDRQDEEPAILSRLRRGERVDHFQTKRKRKDGTLLDISLTISPVKDSHGRIIGASKIARDITDQIRKEEALKRINQALERSNADLEHFAYSASHDLQEPLRMVAVYGEMLRRKFAGVLDPKAHEYIRFVVEGGHRMERLLADLRAFAHASVSGRDPAPVVDAELPLKSALANLQTAIEDSGAEVTFGPLPLVRIHPFQMEQLFQNILGNAIRYRNQDPPRIHIAAEPSQSGWKFSVQDNGIGIEPEYKEHIFELFKRLHASSEYPGSGMGLAICQRIVEQNGGRIWVESEPGRGSTFFFVLPGAVAE